MQKQTDSRAKKSFAVWLAAFAAVMTFGWSTIREDPVGCEQSELTTIPDTCFVQQMAVSNNTAESAKTVCLTFDDGPSKNTPQLLDILAKEQVPATFFVIAADNNLRYLPTIQDEVQQGHQVALHSASHEYNQIYQSPQAFWQDIDTLKERISPYVNTESITCLRFPGGSTNTVSHKYGGSGIMKTLKTQAEEKGYHWIDWNVCANDAVGGHPSADKILRNIQKDAEGKQTCVVLMHDTAATSTTIQAMPAIIQWFREQGYQFCTVEQMLAQGN